MSKTPAKWWSIRTAALIGTAWGLFFVVSSGVEGPPAWMIGRLIGGVLAASFVTVSVTLLRNLLLGARPTAERKPSVEAMQVAPGTLTSNLNRPFALLRIALAILPIALGAISLFILLAGFLSGAPLEIPAFLLLTAMAVFGLGCARVVMVTVGDLLLPRPMLQVDSAGILDRRLGCGLIPWSNIASMVCLDPEQAGWLVLLHMPVRARFSRMRAGTLGVVWRLSASTVYVAMQAASGPHLAPAEIEAFARENNVPTSARRISRLTGRSLPA